MKFCNQCGNQLNDSAQFCPKCGNHFETVFNGQQPQPTPQPAQPYIQYVQAPPQRPIKPNSNMVLAIITTLCFCFILGLYAIILASKVDGLYAAGEYEEAQMKADDAKKWSIIGIVGGIISWLLLIVSGFLSTIAAFASV